MTTQSAHEKFDTISLRLHGELVQAITDMADRLGIPETDEEYPAAILAKIEARLLAAEARVQEPQPEETSA